MSAKTGHESVRRRLPRPSSIRQSGPGVWQSICWIPRGPGHVTVEIITDLVSELDGRNAHPLREGRGASERDVVRLKDGARCMRVALQRGTPSARRLHFWKAGDAIELSRVVLHDDAAP